MHGMIGTGTALVDAGLKVHVYRNLTKGLWSIRHSGRVIAHSPKVVLMACTMRVREGGRQRAIRDGQRNVHAWIEGMSCSLEVSDSLTEIGYNPFRGPTFTSRPGFLPVYEARFVVLSDDGKAYAVL